MRSRSPRLHEAARVMGLVVTITTAAVSRTPEADATVIFCMGMLPRNGLRELNWAMHPPISRSFVCTPRITGSLDILCMLTLLYAVTARHYARTQLPGCPNEAQLAIVLSVTINAVS
jgi:hypothetical protein